MANAFSLDMGFPQRHVRRGEGAPGYYFAGQVAKCKQRENRREQRVLLDDHIVIECIA